MLLKQGELYLERVDPFVKVQLINFYLLYIYFSEKGEGPLFCPGTFLS